MNSSSVRRNSGAALFALTALIVAGCGSSGSKSSGTTAPASSSPTVTAPAATASSATSTTTASTDPALAAKATAAVFQPADFPGGFDPQPPDPTGGLQIERLWQNVAHCLNVDDSSPPATLATSPTFKRGVATQAVSTVEYTSASSATAIGAALSSPMFQACAVSAFNANAKLSAQPGATPAPAVVTPEVAPPVGQKAIAFQVKVNMSFGSGLVISLFHDYIVVVSGNTVTRMWFLNPGSPFPPALEKTLVQKLLTRAG